MQQWKENLMMYYEFKDELLSFNRKIVKKHIAAL